MQRLTGSKAERVLSFSWLEIGTNIKKSMSNSVMIAT